jgi:hypothetical protein
MKINDSNEILKKIYPELGPKNKKVANENFATVLNKALEKSSGQRPVAQNFQILRKEPVMQVHAATAFDKGKGTVIDRLENFIGVLDEYRQMLGDSQVNLKEIYPLIESLEAENESLIPVLDSIADGDKLKEILNKALVTSAVEIFNFKRGDYIVP